MSVQAYHLPRSLPEAIGLLEHHGPDLLVVAGGTVAMPLINDGLSMPAAVMGLRLAGLDALERVDGTLRIGATTTLTRLLDQPEIAMLRDAARNTASWPVRNLATVGGNVFTPPPGGDVAVALLALDGSAVLAGPRGERTVPVDEFFTGFLTTAIADDELLVELRVPTPAEPTAYLKLGRKQANTPAVVTVAARVAWDGATVADARIALGAVGPHPLRARAAEQLLLGSTLAEDAIAAAADAAATDDCEPFTDGVASAWYRRRMCALFVARALRQLASTTPARTAESGGR